MVGGNARRARRRAGAHGHVGRLVVPRGAGWEERAPQPGYPLRRPERRVSEPLLGGGRRLAGEERLQRDEPDTLLGVRATTWWATLPPRCRPPRRRWRAVTEGATGAGEDPAECRLAVVVGRRETVLGREAEVDGRDDRRDGRGEATAQRVELRGRHGVEHEAAAVEVHHHRQMIAAAIPGSCPRKEHPDAEVVGHGMVRGRHAGGVGGRVGRHDAVEQRQEEAVDGAVAAERRRVQNGDGAHEQPRAPRKRWSVARHRRRRHRRHVSRLPGAPRARRGEG